MKCEWPCRVLAGLVLGLTNALLFSFVMDWTFQNWEFWTVTASFTLLYLAHTQPPKTTHEIHH
jgi:hypothetical protein